MRDFLLRDTQIIPNIYYVYMLIVHIQFNKLGYGVNIPTYLQKDGMLLLNTISQLSVWLFDI